MALTPVLDELNVQLANLLGDGRKRLGGAVTPVDDGITYPASMRDEFITYGVRVLVNKLGASFIASRGSTCGYIRFFDHTFTPTGMVYSLDMSTILGDRLSRILDVEINGKRARQVMAADGRNNSVYWQNVPKWSINSAPIVGSTGSLELHPTLTLDVGWINAGLQMTARIWYMLTVPTLQHSGAEDVLMDSYWNPMILSFAEAFARRTHQEFGPFLKKDADEDLEKLKAT